MIKDPVKYKLCMSFLRLLFDVCFSISSFFHKKEVTELPTVTYRVCDYVIGNEVNGYTLQKELICKMLY